MEFVSVIMPTYNKADYLTLTLESFLHQTNDQFEIVLVDDGSTDHTKNVVDHYSKLLSLNYIYQENKGRSWARNTGLRSAKSDIIVFCDDDRMVSTTYIDGYLDLLSEKSRQVVIGWKDVICTINDDRIRESELITKLRKQYGNSKYLFSWDELQNNYEELMESLYLRTPYDNYTFVIDRYGSELKGFDIPFAIAVSGNMGYNRYYAPCEFMDTKFTGWGCEDNEFAYRLMLKGYEFMSSRKVTNHHQRHPVDNQERSSMLLRNMAYFAVKHTNLDVYMFWNAFQNKDRSFDLIYCNETVKLLKNTKDKTILRFADHLLNSWANDQMQILKRLDEKVEDEGL